MGRLSTRFLLCVSCCVYLLSSFAIPRRAHAFQVGAAGFEVSGTVYFRENDRPAENVTVTLRETGGVQRSQAMTDIGGRFNFGNVNRGSYDVTATLTGYEPTSTALTVQNGGGRGAILYLEKTSNPQSGKESQGSSANSGSISAHELSMPQKARDLMLSGKQKIFYGKDVRGGLADFQKAVVVAPGYYEAYYQIGMTLLELGKQDDAEKNFRKAVELSNDKYGEASIGLGTILLGKADAAAAEQMIRHGLELSTNSWLGYYELGRVYLGENRLADAKKAGEQARSLMPNAAIVYRLLANVHMREQDYPALLADIDTYVRLDPDSPAGLHAKEMRAEVIQRIQNEKVVSENAAPK